MPRLSVCLPVYNGATSIEKSIDSILSQSFRDFELLVVDNGSTDDTVEVVEKFDDDRIRLVRNETNIGQLGNHNKCLSLAQGELIAYVHCDDWLLPGCFEKLVPPFHADNVGLAFAPRQIDTTDAQWKARYGRLHTPLEPLAPVSSGPELVRKYVQAGGEGNWIGEPTGVMVRRELLAAVGGFRAHIVQLSDIDAWLRVLARCDVAFVDEELSVRWHHPQSETYAIEDPNWVLAEHLWIVAGLARNQDLPGAVRRRASLLWLRAFGRMWKAILTQPDIDRAAQIRALRDHVREIARKPPA